VHFIALIELMCRRVLIDTTVVTITVILFRVCEAGYVEGIQNIVVLAIFRFSFIGNFFKIPETHFV